MKVIWQDEHKEIWGKLVFDAIERHIPIAEETLKAWEREATICGGSYAEVIREDIRKARVCNKRGCEMLVMED